MVVLCILAIVVSGLLQASLQSEHTIKGFSYKSSYSLELLLKSEELLVKEMEDVITKFGNQTNDLQKKLNWYIGRYKKMAAKMASLSDVTAHAINAFHFLKETVTYWISIMKLYENTDIQEYVEIVDKLKKFREEAQYPSPDDLESVVVSICSMQRTYDLHTEDLVFGNLRDNITNKVFKSFRQMNSDDCLMFGKIALGQGWFNTAVEWMEASWALAENGDKSVQMTSIKQNLQIAVNQHDSMLLQRGPKGVTWETYTTTLDAQLMKERRDQFESRVAEFHPALYTRMGYVKSKENQKRLCQGQQLREPNLDNELVCRYLNNNNPYLFIGPFKVEEKCNDPAMIIYHDFINEAEAEELKEMARKNLTDLLDTITEQSVSSIGLSRITRQALLSYKSNPELVSRISRRVEVATKLKASSQEEFLEMMVLNYGIGGQFDTVSEYRQNLNASEAEYKQLSADGQRIATFSVYLNEVEAGGATVFPSIGITAWPKKMSAVFWYNLQKSGVADYFTLNSECPVLYGEKWVLTQWPLVNPQLFTAPCGLHEFDKHTLLR